MQNRRLLKYVMCYQTKAYIPLQHKLSGVGGWRWAMPPTPEFCVGDTNMLVYFGVTPTPILKFALPPTPTPDASQWNIGGVGPSGVGAGVGHVHFMLFMSISFASGTQSKLVFQWNMGLKGPFHEPTNHADER